MTVIMAIFSAFAPPQDKPDSGSGNSGQTQQEVRITLDGAIDIESPTRVSPEPTRDSPRQSLTQTTACPTTTSSLSQGKRNMTTR